MSTEKIYVQDLDRHRMVEGDEVLHLHQNTLYRGALPMTVLEASGEEASTGVKFVFPQQDLTVTPRFTMVIVGKKGSALATVTENILNHGSDVFTSYPVDVALPNDGFTVSDMPSFTDTATVSNQGSSTIVTIPELIFTDINWYAYLYAYSVKVPSPEL